MSRQSNIRWDLCLWAFKHGHSVGEAIDLVDAVENKSIEITYATSALEKKAAQEEYDAMVEVVKYIYGRIPQS